MNVSGCRWPALIVFVVSLCCSAPQCTAQSQVPTRPPSDPPAAPQPESEQLTPDLQAARPAESEEAAEERVVHTYSGVLGDRTIPLPQRHGPPGTAYALEISPRDPEPSEARSFSDSEQFLGGPEARRVLGPSRMISGNTAVRSADDEIGDWMSPDTLKRYGDRRVQFVAFFSSPCRFERLGRLLDSSMAVTDQLVIHEGMRFIVFHDGTYTVEFVAETPRMPVVVRLQLTVVATDPTIDSPPFTLTLPPVVLDGTGARERHLPSRVVEAKLPLVFSHRLRELVTHRAQFRNRNGNEPPFETRRSGTARFGSVPERAEYNSAGAAVVTFDGR